MQQLSRRAPPHTERGVGGYVTCSGQQVPPANIWGYLSFLHIQFSDALAALVFWINGVFAEVLVHISPYSSKCAYYPIHPHLLSFTTFFPESFPKLAGGSQ